MGGSLVGSWDSPFSLETLSVKEPPDAGSIPAPATRIQKRPREGSFLIFVAGIEQEGGRGNTCFPVGEGSECHTS